MKCIGYFEGWLDHKWFAMIMWQVCSLMLSALAIFCKFLEQIAGFTLPFLQLAISYVALLLINLWKLPKTTASWFGYIMVGLLNLGGDVSSIYAYTLTSISSAQLLVTTVIFWVAPLAFFVFKRKLTLWQILAIFIGMGGVVIVFLEDGVGDSRWLGNMIALISAICYAIATTLEEKLVHEGSIAIYLFRFGTTTSPISIILMFAVEFKTIKKYLWVASTISLIIAYGIVMALYYTLVPVIMKHSNATEMNLSFLTSNFFSLFIDCLIFKHKLTWPYVVGFLCVPFAIVLFCLFPYKKTEEEANQSFDADVESNNDLEDKEKIVEDPKKQENEEVQEPAPN
ncbi:Integral membrane protein, putative [Trichomonas vaginalis G3]|uniref:Integral membrane protein, putative n=1 Tax=Trichomonas vaginalis (strain ATCC PRA-98 / G3) TaxID=412133 RepID=A2FAU5_TRIV3|nr:transmembrane transporter protein [Trichomonas vaginalis G3]EAX97974.1 Integral membrane protein, putative [Trichomonas vaginalis G3]KAI5502577.1 transmembrane transporter protein [Trichomonas vaginalis G3]|eukprot:XP_001310904.1 Integral membrane protein [Trichomonas vaginalis G3]